VGKRSNFTGIEKDQYYTIDPRAIVPKFVEKIRGKTYAEPCYGQGDLEDLLMEAAICKYRADIDSPLPGIKKADALNLSRDDVKDCDLIVTNPPWSRNLLHPMIEHFLSLKKPTWLLFDADWIHTKQSAPYVKYCKSIISVGRLTWIPGTKVTGKDNVCWYEFDTCFFGPTQFYGRSE